MEGRVIIFQAGGFRFGMRLEEILGTTMLEESESMHYIENALGWLRFRSSPIPFVDLRRRLGSPQGRSPALIAIEHPYCTLGLVVDEVNGIDSADEKFVPFPDVIKKTSGSLLSGFFIKNGEMSIILNTKNLVSMEALKELERELSA